MATVYLDRKNHDEGSPVSPAGDCNGTSLRRKSSPSPKENVEGVGVDSASVAITGLIL